MILILSLLSTLSTSRCYCDSLNVSSGVAENILLVLVPGMSQQTVTFARNSHQPRENLFAKLPNLGLSLAVPLDAFITDVGNAFTQIAVGRKVNRGSIGLTQARDCLQFRVKANLTQAESLLGLAKRAGKSVGLITTGNLWDPEVAPFYAQSPSAEFTDNLVRDRLVHDPEERSNCLSFQEQFINEAKNLVKLALGSSQRGNLANASRWSKDYNLVMTEKDFYNSRIRDKSLVGLLPKDAWADLDRKLALVESAISRLRETSTGKTSKNWFLALILTEVARAHESNNIREAVRQTLDVSRLVGQLVDRLTLNKTLIVLASTHGHAFSFGGPFKRAATGGVFSLDEKSKLIGKDGKIITGLLYATGATAPIWQARKAYKTKVMPDSGSIEAHLPTETKAMLTADYAPVFAAGLGANLFNGLYDNVDIYRKIRLHLSPVMNDQTFA